MNLVWFRSDLRVHDNPALAAATKDKNQLVRAIFIISIEQWQQHNWGANKIGFVLKNVLALQQKLAELNIRLDIINCASFAEVPQKLVKYCHKYKVGQLFYNKEYEINECVRDKKARRFLEKEGVVVNCYHDQCLIPPGTIISQQGTPFVVFTPFKKACYSYLSNNAIKLQPKIAKRSPLDLSNIKNPSGINKYIKNKTIESWLPGEDAALKRLDKFCMGNITEYQTTRDTPALAATSGLSPYLAIGAISVRQCLLSAIAANEGIFPGGDTNIMCWIDELLWRDFYKNVIIDNPGICKGENYNQKYNALAWRHSTKDFKAWANGRTGIPIIDAAMRQLVQTGWMHNRLRMITAMFLTKHLLIDWRVGEKFFSKHLIDIDFAANNGGWQWCASTGTDAVPYFRIFNPITQSTKFDSNGAFIKHFCPELAGLDAKTIHNPSDYCSDSELKKLSYPKIMLDLKQARQRALDTYNTK